MAARLPLALPLGAYLPGCRPQDKRPKDKAAPAKADSAKAAGGNQVLAVVNGQPITEADVRAKSTEAFAQLERDYEQNKHQLIQGQLEQLIQDSLLEAEAKARNTTKEQILADLKAPEVTDAEVDTFYEQNKAQIPRPKDQVAGQIKQYLQQRGQAEAREKFFSDLQAKYKVER